MDLCGILMIKILVLFCKCNDRWNTLNCAPYLVYKNKHVAEAYPHFFVLYMPGTLSYMDSYLFLAFANHSKLQVHPRVFRSVFYGM